MAHDVFISHSAKDKLIGDAICANLEAQGIRCWIAPRDILPGKNWAGAIIKGIEDSSIMVLVFSSNSNQSRQVIREVERAVSKGVIIIPFMIEEVSLSDDMEYFISSYHWIDALTPPIEKHIKNLCKTIHLLLAQKAEKNEICLKGQMADTNTELIGISSKLEEHGDKEIITPKFPLKGVVEELLENSREYSSVKVPSPPDKPGSKLNHWTIMGGTDSGNNGYPLYGLARRVALFGQKELSDIPYSKFGKLFTVDRSEIESLRGIQRLIKDYEAKKRPKKPLSIAVFGPPGSGKSFGIKQIAKSTMGDDVSILEFNLSQFTGPKELTDAFHQVRDMVLKGKTPCVFWDEFDSKEYSWLQYLLAPMQDGEFREGQLVHPIGKCVFVFAGGTSYDMENFGPPDENSEEYKKFKMLKGPDFASRLNGYLNVLGPNKRQIFDICSGNWIDVINPEDILFPVRRALLMRVILEYFGNEKLDIDRGLLTAFIEIDKYKHGARSLETILLLSKRVGAKAMRRSDLPPREQMSMHVDYEKFIDLVNRDLLFKLNRETIAPSIHEFYRKLGHKEGWIKPEMDKPYKDLDEETKEDNLAAAERIPDVLRLVGLEIVTKGHPGTIIDSNGYEKILGEKNNLERMAEAEHDGWWEFELLNGWEFDEVRNDYLKKHNCLIPYNKLSETDKDKDRNSVKSYFEILKNAEFQIIRSK